MGAPPEVLVIGQTVTHVSRQKCYRCVPTVPWNRYLGGPAFLVAPGGGIPDPLPVPVLAVCIDVYRLASHAIGIDVEGIAASALVVGIEGDRKSVLPERDIRPAKHFCDDLVRFAVEEAGREIEGVAVVGDVDAGLLGRLGVLVGD